MRELAQTFRFPATSKDRLAEIWVDHMEAEAEVARSQGTQRADRTGTTPQEV